MSGLKSTTDTGYTLLHEAVAGKSHEILSVCLKAGLEIDSPNGAGETPLLQAVKIMDLHAVRMLLHAKADVNKMDQFGFRPIDIAARQAHMKHAPEILELLINNRADIADTQSAYVHMSPIHIAIQSGELNSIKPFFTRKSALEYRETHTGFTPLLGAVSEGHKALLKFLISKGAKVDAADYKGRTALHVAVEMGHLSLFPYLIKECKIDPNKKDKEGLAAIHIAIDVGNVSGINTLFDMQGVDLSLKDSDENTILHLASAQGNVKAFGAVLAHLPEKFDVNALNKRGETALHSAAESDQTLHLKTLIEMGLDIEAKNHIDASPLAMAVFREARAAAETLIEAGADIKAVLNDGSTLMHMAAQNCDTRMIDTLVEAGAELNALDDSGFAPIHYAIENFDIDTLDTLIAAGARVDVKTPDGTDLFSFAVDLGDEDIVTYLKDFMELPPEKLKKAFNKDKKIERPELNIRRRRLS